MNKRIIAKAVLKVAQMILADWKKLEVPADQAGFGRNELHLPSRAEWGASLAKALRDVIIKEAKNSDINLVPRELKQEWSEYYTITDPSTNANKYHYYAIYSFEDENGDTKYAGANCSGRIGIIEREYDLTKKNSGGPVDTYEKAMADVQQHLKTKVAPSKGYKKTNMVKGSVKMAEDMPRPSYVDPRLVKKDGEMVGETSLNSVEDTKGMDFDVFHSDEEIVASRLVKMAKMLLSAGTFPCPECGTKVLENTGYCLKCKEKVKKATTGTFPCPECGTKVLENTGYCLKCKGKVKKAEASKATFPCPECGTKVLENTGYCLKCKGKVSK